MFPFLEAFVDRDMDVKHWHHAAETITLLAENNEVTSAIQIFTDGSTSQQGVGAGLTIFRSGNHIKSLKYRLNKRRTNSEAEQLAIVRALQYMENLETEDIINKNSILEEIKSRLRSGNACYHSVQNLLSSRLLSQKFKD